MRIKTKNEIRQQLKLMENTMKTPETLETAIKRMELNLIEALGVDDAPVNKMDKAVATIEMYKEDRGYVPAGWAEYYTYALSIKAAMSLKLVKMGLFTADDLEQMTFQEVREELENTEKIEVKEVTSNGGVKTNYIEIPKAA